MVRGVRAIVSDFSKLWLGQTVSIFGTLVSRTALPFTAILLLDAGAIEMGLLRAIELAPGLVCGLVIGVWVDRLRRRAVMIVADLVRAAALVTVPVAWWVADLRMEQLYLVALVTGLFTLTFDVAYQAYLPSLVPVAQLTKANARLAASASAAEVTSFGIGGALVQLLTAPGAIVVDAVSFLWSAVTLAWIRKPESPPERGPDANVAVELKEGFRTVRGDAVLRPLLLAMATFEFAVAFDGAIFLLFVTQGLGFSPGPLGLIFAVGGVSSFIGAMVAERHHERLHIGRTLIVSLLVASVGLLFVPLAPGASLAGVAFLVLEQIVFDSGYTMLDIQAVSLRQHLVPEALLGRVNSLFRVGTQAAGLVGVVTGGILGEVIGLRPTLVVGAATMALGTLWLLTPSVRTLRRPGTVAIEVQPAANR